MSGLSDFIKGFKSIRIQRFEVLSEQLLIPEGKRNSSGKMFQEPSLDCLN